MVQPLNLFDAVDARRPADEPLAWDRAVTRGKFRARVVAWADWFGAMPGNAFALFQRDAVEFAAVLFGAWQARKTIFLPGDHLPATCVELNRSVAGFLGDFPDPWHPLSGPPDDGASSCQHFAPVDAEFTGLVLYTSGSTGAPQPIAKNLAQMAAEVAHLEEQFGWLFGVAEIVTTVSHQHIYGLL